MSYAETIRARRQNLNMTQEELAEAMACPVSRISRWESGEQQPNLMQVPFLCAALDMSYETFFGVPSRSRRRKHRIGYQLSYLPIMCNYKIATMRQRQNMSIEDFAAACGVDVSLAKRWEAGTAIPKLPMITDICSVLKIRLRRFFE